MEQKENTNTIEILVTPFTPRFPLEQKVASKAIELRAWQLWKEEGKPVGKDIEFWVKAENEILGLTRVVSPVIAATEAVTALGNTTSIEISVEPAPEHH